MSEIGREGVNVEVRGRLGMYVCVCVGLGGRGEDDAVMG
jgi:hypothetical protein